MNLSEETLKQILISSGYVNEEEYDKALTSAKDLGRDPVDILIFRGFINEKTMGELVAKYLKVGHVDLSKLTLPEEVITLIPEKMARLYRMVPFESDGKKLKLAMSNPEDFEALEFAKRQTGLQIEEYYSSKEDIVRALGQYNRNIRSDFDSVIAENVKKARVDTNLEKAAENIPVVKIFDTILTYAIAEKASDIHIEVQSDEVIVRFRIDGALRDIIRMPRGIENGLIARIKILSNLKIDEHRIPQDGRYKFTIDDDIVSLRISIIPTFYGENIVMRLLRESARPLSLEELGLSGHNLEVIRENITKPHGMILVTGPTGSGKTTTLYSVLNIINTVEVNICTIEDPIEYSISRVNQVQVNPKTGLTFAAGLRAFLRHDPNVIMVGEIRDQETAEIAVHSALTGHLVLSTLHTNTAAGAIPRFIDMGVEGFLLASTLNVILAQRLIRKLCSSCVKKYEPKAEVLARLSKDLHLELKGQKFYKGEGCKECNFKGYTGRIGIYEALAITEPIRELIVNKATSDEIEAKAISEGMVTMLHDGLDKVSSGLTTIEEVLRAVRES